MTTPPRTRRIVTDLIGLAVSCALMATLIYLAAVHTTLGQRLDDHLRGGLLQSDDPRAYAATSSLLDTISVSSLALMGAAIMGIALVRRRPRLAVAAGLLVLGANVTTQILKPTLSRPDLVSSAWADTGSYPSGHVTVAMSLAMALILVAPPTLRIPAAIAGGVYALGVGVAVIALNWHRPSDVLGAYLMVTTWTCLVAAALTLWPDRVPAGRVRGGARWWGVALAAVLAGFIAIVAARAAHRLDLLDLAADRTGFVATAIVCSALGAALVTLVTVLVGGRAISRQDTPSG